MAQPHDTVEPHTPSRQTWRGGGAETALPPCTPALGDAYVLCKSLGAGRPETNFRLCHSCLGNPHTVLGAVDISFTAHVDSGSDHDSDISYYRRAPFTG